VAHDLTYRSAASYQLGMEGSAQASRAHSLFCGSISSASPQPPGEPASASVDAALPAHELVERRRGTRFVPAA
jgi:hypothetical protein